MARLASRWRGTLRPYFCSARPSMRPRPGTVADMGPIFGTQGSITFLG